MNFLPSLSHIDLMFAATFKPESADVSPVESAPFPPGTTKKRITFKVDSGSDMQCVVCEVLGSKSEVQAVRTDLLAIKEQTHFAFAGELVCRNGFEGPLQIRVCVAEIVEETEQMWNI